MLPRPPACWGKPSQAQVWRKDQSQEAPTRAGVYICSSPALETEAGLSGD